MNSGGTSKSAPPVAAFKTGRFRAEERTIRHRIPPICKNPSSSSIAMLLCIPYRRRCSRRTASLRRTASSMYFWRLICSGSGLACGLRRASCSSKILFSRLSRLYAAGMFPGATGKKSIPVKIPVPRKKKQRPMQPPYMPLCRKCRSVHSFTFLCTGIGTKVVHRTDNTRERKIFFCFFRYSDRKSGKVFLDKKRFRDYFTGTPYQERL